MGYVGGMSQCVYHECIHPFECIYCGIRYGFGIGYVAEAADAESEYSQLVVHHRQCCDSDSAGLETIHRPYDMDIISWYSGIWVFCEAIWHAALNVVGGIPVTVDRERLFSTAIWPQVVSPAHMVVMQMGDEQCVQVAVGMVTEHLLSEVRTAVNQERTTVCLH